MGHRAENGDVMTLDENRHYKLFKLKPNRGPHGHVVCLPFSSSAVV